MEPQTPVDKRVQACLPVICRKWNLQGMPHLLALVNRFLGPPPRTVAQVCKMNAPILLQRILALDELEPAYSVKKYPEFRHWQFNEGMRNAIRGGYLEVVELLLVSFPSFKVSLEVANAAAIYGRLEIMKLLFTHQATTVARAGINVDQDADNADIIDDPHADFARSSGLVGSALEHGHLELAQWLLPRVDRVSPSWLHAALKSGNLEAVHWVYALPCRYGDPSGVTEAAVQGGNVEILKWLLDHFVGFVDMNVVVSCGHFDTIEWVLTVHRSKCFGLKRAAVEAAGRGRLDIVRFLRRHYQFEAGNPGAIDSAAQHGHLELVQWLHENTTWGCTEAAMDAAAGNGHLDVVKWLHQNRTEGCSKAAMDIAAGNGHLNVVKWLNENRSEGCTAVAIEVAANNGFDDVVIWLIEYQRPTCFPSVRAMDLAAIEGRLKTVQLLAESGMTCTRAAMDGAAANGHLNVVKWLHENRNEGCTTKAMDEAARNGQFEMVQWLHLNRTESCSDAAIRLAVRYGHLDVVRFLREKVHANFVGRYGLVNAMDTAHFDAVVYVCLELGGDIVGALLDVPKLYMRQWQFFDWLYFHYPHRFVSEFLDICQSRYGYGWGKLCSLPKDYPLSPHRHLF